MRQRMVTAVTAEYRELFFNIEESIFEDLLIHVHLVKQT